jgi:hypothetical protein
MLTSVSESVPKLISGSGLLFPVEYPLRAHNVGSLRMVEDSVQRPEFDIT